MQSLMCLLCLAMVSPRPLPHQTKTAYSASQPFFVQRVLLMASQVASSHLLLLLQLLLVWPLRRMKAVSLPASSRSLRLRCLCQTKTLALLLASQCCQLACHCEEKTNTNTRISIEF
jgi:hypothetical protein